MLRVGDHRISRLRQRIYEILEHGPVGDRTGRNVSRLIVALISINVVVVALESFRRSFTCLALVLIGPLLKLSHSSSLQRV